MFLMIITTNNDEDKKLNFLAESSDSMELWIIFSLNFATLTQ